MSHELPIFNLKIQKRKSLLAILDNILHGGDNYTFRNLYARDENGKEYDILEDGKNGCGVFISWILLTLELIKRPHSTIQGTEKDLIESGWFEIDKPRPGAILLWEEKKGIHSFLGGAPVLHRHIGFYIGGDQAVSNDSLGTGFPWQHHYTYNDTRKIEKIYWHSSLDQ